MDEKTEAEPSLLNGYPKLASRMGQKSELAIFRRFLTLNTENLLYMQAELALLELELRDIVNEDLHSGMRRRKKHSTSFLALKESGEHGNKVQWLKRLEIKEKLKEYNEALLQLAQLHTLKQPDPGDLSVLRNWLDNEHGGNKFLEDDEASVWTELHEGDLFTMAPRIGEGDDFTRWIDGPVLDFLHEKLLYNIMSKRKSRVFDPETGIIDYKDKTLLKITDNISTVVASLFPVIAIIILYFIKNTPARLGAIAGFEILFALGLTFFTKAKRFDIFAANAAFAAVQVVFIGTNNNGEVA